MEEACNKMFVDKEESMTSKQDVSEIETVKEEPGEEPMEVDGNKKGEKREKKRSKDKKDKKMKKEKTKTTEEEEEEEMVIPEPAHPLPPPILKETELKST